ncbi:MAG TPA: DUF1232 domain-containing protein [Thermoanaerobaculia bacterium]|jgi:uncharacterized membrane protein YkvA (DUF1232 family)|nr:DUF1232 domain-containing protein [Thermoanaerobaculia bacterium]
MPYDPTLHDPLTQEALEDFDAARAEREAEEALDRGTQLPSTGLLSFYDRLREAIFKRVEKRGGKLSEGTVRALMLVPDVFILLVRLALDKEVPGSSRALIGGALAYFILPFDLLPEEILGPVGYLDDLVLATAVLAQAFGGDLEPYARKHWSGKEDLRVVLRDITEATQSLLGQNLYGRLRRLLARRGVKLEEPARRIEED